MDYASIVPHQFEPGDSPWQVENGIEHVEEDKVEEFAAPLHYHQDVLWHVSPRQHRRNIQQHGLLAPSRPNAARLRGVYFSDGPRQWIELFEGQEVDFWAVRVTGLSIHHDPEMGMDGNYVFLGNIHPNRLQLAKD